MAAVAEAAAVILTVAAILADKAFELLLAAVFALIIVLSMVAFREHAPQRTRVVGLRPRCDVAPGSRFSTVPYYAGGW